MLAAIVVGCAPSLNVAPPDLNGARLTRFELPRANTPQYYQTALDAYNVAAKVADHSLLGVLELNEAGVILNGFPEVKPALFSSDARTS